MIEPAGTRLHVRTYIEQDERGWWCVVDFGRVLASGETASVEEVQPFRVGPWPSRQVARRELRGRFRQVILTAVNDLVRRSEGRYERYVMNEEPEPRSD